jgi:hypothetical protein
MRQDFIRPSRAERLLILALILALGAGAFLVRSRAFASAPAAPPNDDAGQAIDNDTCFACHSAPGLTTELASGELLFLTVERDVYQASIHGRLGYACIQCHTNITGFPHPEMSAGSLREFTVERYPQCGECHQDKYEATLDSVHQVARAGGNLEAAVCSDCHTAHAVQAVAEQPRSAIPRTCERCHSQIYNLYRESVHGSALLEQGNPDVPTCIDCHGVHDVQGPTTGPFRLFSPQICAGCHADPDRMGRYGISTDVFDTYVSDFHGTTVVLFEAVAPDQATNKPTCIDCHGVHDMRRTDDPESRVIKENLLSTCQRCHRDATANFPAAWLSHYRPSPETAPLVYFVNLFYRVLIPTLVGGMLMFVGADALRRRRKGKPRG